MITRQLVLAAALAAGLVSTSASAMLDVSSSYPSGYKGRISVKFNEAQDVVGFQFTDTQGSDLNYTPDQMRRGVVLLHAMNKDIIRMVSPQFDTQEGGTIHLVFLRNFFGSDYRKVDVDFVRGVNWEVWTNDVAGKETFDGLHVQVKNSMGVPSSVNRVHLRRQGTIVRDLDPMQLPQAPASLLRWMGLIR
ncbi:MAG: hypothetical protein IT285_11785 [Bdellovibrionales bacterium]|nr:hypothetical protein [Bdellovibrionales bacterium]